MKQDERFTQAFAGYLSRNKGPDGQPAEYGIVATGDEAVGTIELTLIFKTGVRYCCYEWECHMGILRPGGWDSLRKNLSEYGLHITSKITLHLHVIVEQGAVIIVDPTPISRRQEYQETIQEGKEIGYRIPSPPAGFTGVWTTRWENGQIYAERSYANGLLHGKSTEWNDRGQKLREYTCKNGLRHGTLTQWNTNGEIKDVSEWDNGTGTYRIYFSSGILASEQQLHHGKPHGVKKEWDGSGNLICTDYYEDGVLVRREGKPRWQHLCANQDKPTTND